MYGDRIVNAQNRSESKQTALREDKLDEISARLEHSLKNPLDTLNRRWGFKVSGLLCFRKGT
jgi:hypothetical protein